MKRRLFVSLVLFVIAVSQKSYGSDPLTMESAVSHALSNNVELAAVRFTIAEAQARVGQAGRWSNPELETEFAPNLNGRERSWRVGFDQRFPLTSRLRIEKQITRTQVKLALSELQDFERRLSHDVRLTFLNLAALEAQIRLKIQQGDTLNELAGASEQAAQAGEGSSLDVALIGLELVQLDSQRLKLESERRELTRNLTLLLGVPPEAELLVVDNLELSDSIPSSPINLEKRPDYISALVRKDVAAQSIKLAHASRWEDASIGLFGGVDRTKDEPIGIESDRMVGIRFSIPLPLWKNNKGRIAESNAAAQRIEKELEATSIRITSEVKSAHEQMRAALNLAQSLKSELLPKAIALEQRLTALSKEGQASFTDVARARERRLQFESAELDARRDFHLAQAQYWNASGISTLSKP